MSKPDTLIPLLADSPRVLILGQSLLGRNDATNPLTKNIYSGRESFLEECISDDWKVKQDLLDAASNAVPFDDSFELLKQFPWRCIFTSAIDATPFRLFNSQTRPVQSIFDARKAHLNNLSLYRLFGATGRSVAAELPPISKKELRNRWANLSELLLEIPRSVGPEGRLYIDGWNPYSDWLRPRDLAASLYQLVDGQILLFGIDESDEACLNNDDDFAAILNEGKAILFRETLSESLAYAASQGTKYVEKSVSIGNEISIPIRSMTPKTEDVSQFDDLFATKQELKSIVVSAQEYSRLTETFDLPTSQFTGGAPVETDFERSQRFLDFLSRHALSDLNNCSRFGFERSVFRSLLLPAIYRSLDTSAPQETTVLLSGQTGSGKSTMMGLLAVHLRRAGIPVIVIANRLLPPNKKHLQAILELIDRESSVATVVLWDGLEKADEYHELSNYFASLGKKALVVGTTYEQPFTTKQSKSVKLIPVSVSVEEEERQSIVSHFSKFVPDQEPHLRRYNFKEYNNFFALIYYLTGASRLRLSEGVTKEYESQIRAFEDHIASQPVQKEYVSDLAAELRKALGSKLDIILKNAHVKLDAEGKDLENSAALKLVRAVMLTSSMGLKMPQSIALSLCSDGNANKFDIYREAFKRFPVITTSAESEPETFVESRLPLEATIWCERMLPNKDARHEVALEVARQIDSREAMRPVSAELEFVVKLLQAIGPQGTDQNRMVRGYDRIAECISSIQERCDRLNPRLLHLKANCYRENVKREQQEVASQNNGEFYSVNTPDEKLVLWNQWLVQAVQTLQEAETQLIHQLDRNPASRGTRQLLATINTEKAATIGIQLGCLTTAMRKGTGKTDFRSLEGILQKAREAWQRSVSINEESVHAIDVACWIIANALENLPVNEDRFDLLAEFSDLIDRYQDSDLTPEQQSTFDQREATFSRLNLDETRLMEVIGRSVKRGDYSVHALIARSRLTAHGPDAAINYLRKNCEDVLLTERPILFLYYRLWWKLNSKQDGFFAADQLVLRWKQEQWRELKHLAESRLALEGESENRVALFHLAWSSIQLGESKTAQDLLRHLETVSMGSFRRGKSLAIISDSQGAREFSGEVRPNPYPHLGRVWIEELRMEVPYKVFEFGDPKDPGDVLSPFHIALNYRGAYAQPVSRLEKVSRS
jgi:hypothetical protein